MVFACLSILLSVYFSWQLIAPLGKTSLLLLFLFLAIVNSALSGGKSGLLITFISAGSIAIFSASDFSIYPKNIIAIYELVLYFSCGISVSFVIDHFRKTNLVNEFKRKNQEIGERLDAVELEKHKLAYEVKLRDEFLSIASHELKTPLTSMLLKIQLILHNIRNVSLANFSVENLLKMLITAEGQTKRLAKMITDLLNISLITTGRLDVAKEQVDLVQIVKEVVEEFKERFESGGYKVMVKTVDSLPLKVDKMRIVQAVSNLVSNAIKYGQGKPLEVEVSERRNVAKIMIKDQGIGISRDQQKRIFELFERAVNGTEYRGLGVGLYIAHQIILAHGGKIKVDSRVNHGSTFTIELPIA